MPNRKMSNSKSFNLLKKHSTSIQQYFLPPINILGEYTQKEIFEMRTCILLVHAEIEYYFETVSKEKANYAHKEWDKHKTKSNVLLALVTFNSCKLQKDNFQTGVSKALTLFYNKISKNHGIKQDNINDLLFPIGILETDLDKTWLNNMSSFGEDRGFVAHNSISVKKILNPDDIRNLIKEIMKEIIVIDLLIKKLK